MPQIFEISGENAWPLDEADFLTNYTNKQNFVNLLVYKLELHGFKALLCPSDADITIEKTSLQVTIILQSPSWQTIPTFFVYFCIKYTTQTTKTRFT